MIVGIVTFHKPYNFGGCLQALATSYILSSLGHTPYFVDYWPKYHQEQYSIFSFHRFFTMPTVKDSIFYLRNSIVNFKANCERRKVFTSFINRYISPQSKPVCECFDVIVYGSDQIWRKQPGLNKYNPVYFACNQFKASRHVAFSASMGILPHNSEDDALLKDYIGHFSQMSVREGDLKEYVEKLGFKDVYLTLDPTLLLTINDWNKIIKLQKFDGRKYLLVYALNGCFDYTVIQQFAQSKGLDVKYIDGNSKCITNHSDVQTVGPDDFVNLIRNAEYVLSSSFHGLAFSIIFHKEFYVSFKVNAARAKTLLDNCGLSNRFLAPYSPIPVITDSIDYVAVDLRLQNLRNRTLRYLKSI